MLINDVEYTFGADPELFLRRPEQAEEKFFWSADGLIPGTKEKPHKIPGGAVQVDGMALEFNINPVKTEKGFFTRTKNVLSHIKKNFVDPLGLQLVPASVAYFEEEHYESCSEKAKELGCNPDWNAYTKKHTPTPKPPKEYFRTGAGHIHVGWNHGMDVNDPNLHEACQYLVMHMDRTLGDPLSMIAQDWKRRDLYGNRGAYRPTTYGVEYRTPSNYWLSHPDLVKWVINKTIQSIKNAYKYDHFKYKVSSAPEV